MNYWGKIVCYVEGVLESQRIENHCYNAGKQPQEERSSGKDKFSVEI